MLDKTRARAYIYHATEEPKIVYLEDEQEWYDKGWADSPAAFFDMKSHGLDPENKMLVQKTGEDLAGIKDAVNGALNLAHMTKRELTEYAEKNFGTELSMTKMKHAEMVSAIEGMLALQGD